VPTGGIPVSHSAVQAMGLRTPGGEALLSSPRCHENQLELNRTMDFDAEKGGPFVWTPVEPRRQVLSHARIHPTVHDIRKQIDEDIGEADKQQTTLH